MFNEIYGFMTLPIIRNIYNEISLAITCIKALNALIYSSPTSHDNIVLILILSVLPQRVKVILFEKLFLFNLKIYQLSVSYLFLIFKFNNQIIFKE